MKTKNHGLDVEPVESPPKKLKQEAKKTSATRQINSLRKPFSTGDLWNIHRRKKNTRLKRNYI